MATGIVTVPSGAPTTLTLPAGAVHLRNVGAARPSMADRADGARGAEPPAE